MNSIREVSNPRRKPMMIGYKSCDDNSRQTTTLPHRVFFHSLSKKKEEILVGFHDGSVWIVGSGCEIGGENGRRRGEIARFGVGYKDLWVDGKLAACIPRVTDSSQEHPSLSRRPSGVVYKTANLSEISETDGMPLFFFLSLFLFLFSFFQIPASLSLRLL